MTAFLTRSRNDYIAERVAAGDDVSTATRAADETIAASFPDGKAAARHLVFRLEDDGHPIGSLWIGPAHADDPNAWWVWDIAIDEGSRGQGYGKAAMLLAEHEARTRGATVIGLNVFGTNTIARHLYESLGYTTVAIRMSKAL
jgi:ribosomal protein S18 acetylase RimI-like enzyme